MAKFFENALSEMASKGLEELRAANAGQMAMDAPPIQPVEQPSYEAALNQAAVQAEARSVEPSQGMER